MCKLVRDTFPCSAQPCRHLFHLLFTPTKVLTEVASFLFHASCSGLALGLSLIPLSPHHTSNDQRTEVILSRRRITVIAPSSDSPQCVYFQAFPKEYYAEEGEEAEEEEQQLREPLISTSGVADPDDEDNMPWVANTNRKLAERPNGGRDEWGSHHGRQAQGRSSQYGDGAMSRRRVGPVGR